MVVTNFFCLGLNMINNKIEEYHLALRTGLGNLRVVNSIGHLGAHELPNLLYDAFPTLLGTQM
jgi:hypothetical protein